MSTMLDRLRRFRPLGSPGGAGSVGVPASPGSGLPAELVPVFAALDSTVAGAVRIVADATREAHELDAAAEREATQLIADARRAAAAARAERAAEVRAAGKSRADRTRSTADAEARRLVERRAELDPVVAVVLQRLRDDVLSTVEPG